MFKTISAPVAAAMVFAAGLAFAHAYQVGALKIGHPWTRPTPPGAATAAGYLTITNTGRAPDKLVGVSSPLAGRIEIHRSTTAGGVMRMRPLPDGLPILPGQTVTLQPLGDHLMMIGLRRALGLGDHMPATLRFEHAGDVSVYFLVQSAASPSGAPMKGMPGM